MFRSYYGNCDTGVCGCSGEPMSKEFERALLAEKERRLEEALKSVRELRKNLEAAAQTAK